jgi:hypothetical protein
MTADPIRRLRRLRGLALLCRALYRRAPGPLIRRAVRRAERAYLAALTRELRAAPDTAAERQRPAV